MFEIVYYSTFCPLSDWPQDNYMKKIMVADVYFALNKYQHMDINGR
jgi:hypothetical protein